MFKSIKGKAIFSFIIAVILLLFYFVDQRMDAHFQSQHLIEDNNVIHEAEILPRDRVEQQK